MHKNHMSQSEHQNPFPTLHAQWFIGNQDTHLSDENTNLFFHLIDCFFFLARNENTEHDGAKRNTDFAGVTIQEQH